ncbi:MAG: hypothetical protein ACRECX_06945 [Methyloceanibacter sp.]|uniref:hypothetical protein n=1 Tax=Methyloceanibacter sp. TaxID=1965321 RepID=UPI003D6CA384
MRTVLAATLLGLFICGSPTPIYAGETGQAPEGAASAVPDETAPPAPPTNAKPDEAEESGEDQTDPSGVLMKDFTRHRPGACPEGPPCKMDDEE